MEKLSMQNDCEVKDAGNRQRYKTITLAKIAVLSAVASILMLFEIPIFFIPGFYKLDFSEIPVLLGAFAMGPVAGIIIEAVKILLNFVIDGSVTAGLGEVANFLIGSSFVVPAAIIYKRNKTRKNAIIGLMVGLLLMVILSAIMNLYILLPVYAAAFKIPVDAIISMGKELNPAITDLNSFILFATVPFNIIKGFLASLITILIYKKLSPLLHS